MTTETSATGTPTMDQERMEAFVGKVLGDTSATMATAFAIIGDRLGLFKDLAAHGPATSAELAARTGINERYAREWLGGMATAGYLEYEPAAGRFDRTRIVHDELASAPFRFQRSLTGFPTFCFRVIPTVKLAKSGIALIARHVDEHHRVA